jgi:hypothetical protein
MKSSDMLHTGEENHVLHQTWGTNRETTKGGREKEGPWHMYKGQKGNCRGGWAKRGEGATGKAPQKS